jgi:hypothetical protein
MAASEQLHFRDEKISQWHRELGFDYPAVDLDFILVEYTRAIPAAIIEYKHSNCQRIEIDHPSYRVLRRISNALDLPLFAVRYDFENYPEPWFRVVPLNVAAKRLVPSSKTMAAMEYRGVLRQLRADALSRWAEEETLCAQTR